MSRFFILSIGSAETDWALDNFYIGNGCPKMCKGHGRCTASGTCACDRGFSGADCSISSAPLPTQLAVSVPYTRFRFLFTLEFYFVYVILYRSRLEIKSLTVQSGRRFLQEPSAVRVVRRLMVANMLWYSTRRVTENSSAGILIRPMPTRSLSLTKSVRDRRLLARRDLPARSPSCWIIRTTVA